jgi:hypothetical protein
MLGAYQKYEVTVKFTYESEVFPEDPDDVFELAELEKLAVVTDLNVAFPELEVKELEIVPVIGE